MSNGNSTRVSARICRCMSSAVPNATRRYARRSVACVSRHAGLRARSGALSRCWSRLAQVGRRSCLSCVRFRAALGD